MKRLVSILFMLCVFALGALLIVPGLIDWTPHRDRVAQAMARVVGRPVAISGAIKIRMLPAPHIVAEGVTVANLAGAQTPYFLKAESIEAQIPFGPLLEGRIVIDSVALAGLDMQMEAISASNKNWAGLFPALSDAKSSGRLPVAVSVGRVTILGGAVRYLSVAQGVDVSASNIDLVINAPSAGQGYRAEGSVRVGASTLSIRGTASLPESDGAILLTAEAAGGPGAPVARFTGKANLAPTLSVQGAVEVSGGDLLAALSGRADEAAPPSLNGAKPLTATLSYKDNGVRLDDLKASLGQAGTASGSAGLTLTPGTRPRLGVMLDLRGVDVPSVEAWPSLLPAGVDVALTLQGHDLLWRGARIPEAAFSAVSDGKAWTVGEASARLADSSSLRLSGAGSVLGLNLETPDLPALIKLLPLGPQSALTILADAPLWRKATLTATVDMKPENIGLSDIIALFDDRVKVTGAIDVARNAAKPAFAAHLALDGVDSERFSPEVIDSARGAIARSEAGLDLTFSNARVKGVGLRSVTLSAMTEGGDFVIKDLTAALSDEEGFDVSGRMTGFHPVSGFAVSYGVKVADAGALARTLGVPVPPLVRDWRGASLRGKAEGTPAKYTFTVTGRTGGGEISLDGTRAGDSYTMTAELSRKSISRAAWGFTTLPGERLLTGAQGVFRLSGLLTGTEDSYAMSDIRTGFAGGAATGSLTVKDDKGSAELTVDKADFSGWDDWAMRDSLTVSLKAGAVSWRGLNFDAATARVEAGPGFVAIPKLSGRVWGGTGEISLRGTRKEGAWRTVLSGALRGAEIDRQRAAASLSGMTLGKGDVKLDMTSPSSGVFDSLAMAEGSMTLTPSTLSIDGFNAAEAARVAGLSKGQNLQRVLNAALKESKPGTPYAAVTIPVQFHEGRARIEGLTLAGAGHEVSVSASREISSGAYDLAADLRFTDLEGAPPVRLRRGGTGQKDTGGYGVDVSELEAWLNARTPVPAQEVTPLQPVAPVVEQEVLP